MTDIYFMDTFAGMGGLRIGVETALKEQGYNPICVKTSEIKSAALTTLRTIYPEEEFEYTDITKVDTSELPHIDGLIGGFPCQTFSYAGKRKGLEDTRGTLFYELARIMKEKQPQWAIFENVKGLLTHDGGQTFETILHTFYSLGYHVSFQVMDAKHYGVANSRPRVFIVCHRETEIQMRIPVQQTIPFSTIKQTLPVEDSEYTRKLLAKYTPEYLRGKKVTDKAKSKNIIHTWEFEARGPVNGTQVKIMEHLRDQYINGKRGSKGSNYEVLASHFGDIKDDIADLLEKRYIQYKEAEDEYRVLAGELSGQFTRFVDPRKPLPTLVATSLPHMGVVEEGGIRQVSLYEATRALGFPDDYALPDTISETWAYDLLGNTVAPPVVTLIMEEIIKQSEVLATPSEELVK